jgi:hypothetical protein
MAQCSGTKVLDGAAEAFGMRARVRREVHSFAGGTAHECACSNCGPGMSTYQRPRVAAHLQCINDIRSCNAQSQRFTPGAAEEGWVVVWMELEEAAKQLELPRGHNFIPQPEHK